MTESADSVSLSVKPSAGIQYAVASNNATTVWVWGPLGGITSGDNYEFHDYHLKSMKGRYTTAGWVMDNVHSPCIDAGDPTSDYSLEPLPNGSVINMGAYGGSVEASKEHIPFGTMFIVR